MLKIIAVIVSLVIIKVSSHGMLMDPPNRSSLWRFDRLSPTNYADNQNFCGGAWTHHGINKGKCGVCGDNYKDPHPQKNENTGKFGRGKIVAIYKSGQVIEATSHITANHLGNIRYHLCEIEDSNAPESGEDCFMPLRFADGKEKFPILAKDKVIQSKIQLPKGFKCKHCVLRWTYTAGNSWGVCEDGTGAMGCGAQETFRSCADIKII